MQSKTWTRIGWALSGLVTLFLIMDLVGSPLFTHVLFGVYLGVIAWGGLWFRDPRVRALIPLSR